MTGSNYNFFSRPHVNIANREAARREAAYLNSRQDECCCAFYDAGASTTTAIFGGSAEQFHILSVASRLKTNVVVFNSEGSFWFKGSLHLPNIEEIGRDLANDRFGKISVLFGQSSGGYAALAASKHLEGATAIAVSPQTFDDRAAKSSMRISSFLKPSYTEADLLDLRQYLADATNSSQRAIILSASEYSTPYEGLFWIDHLHGFRMIDVPTVQIFMLRSSLHSSVWRNADNYAKMLADVAQCDSTEQRRDAIFAGTEVVSANVDSTG